LVKNYMRSGNFEGTLRKNFYGVIQRPFEPINRKVITPSEKELERNPRSRSAKLRIAERNDD
jgi:16S rRNA (cytosine1402-N4)-methyltransferase